MQRYIRDLSPRAEFTIVVSLAFGYFIFASALTLFVPSVQAAISEAELRFLIAYESVVLTFLGSFLWVRGWSFQLLGLQPTIKDTATGVGLGLLAYVTYAAVWLVFGSLMPGVNKPLDDLVVSSLSVSTVLAASAVNAIFEEVFVCGYIIVALKSSRSVWFAINVSIAVRVAYHLYQGAFGVISIIPVGLVFAHWFARTGRLWPVITAHALFDMAGLWTYIGDQ